MDENGLEVAGNWVTDSTYRKHQLAERGPFQEPPSFRERQEMRNARAVSPSTTVSSDITFHVPGIPRGVFVIRVLTRRGWPITYI